MASSYRGIFTIAATPFKEDWSVDWEGLKRIVDFCVECGAHGLVWPVMASQFTALSDEERLKGFEIVVDQVAGRTPVMLGVAGVTATHASMFARRAQEVGADSVIAMTPYLNKLGDPDAQVAYFKAVAGETSVPICLQNHTMGSELSVSTLARILREVEGVEYIKEETMPVTHKLTGLAEMDLPQLKGVFGGAGGRYMLLEYPRGVAGQMPGCHVTDVMVRYWDALEAGNWPEAKRIYGLLAPLYAIEMTCPGAIYKEVLRRRGVIDSSRSRNAPPNQMDEQDHRSLDDILRDLEPLFTWPGGKPLEYGVSHPEAAIGGSDEASNASGGSVPAFDR